MPRNAAFLKFNEKARDRLVSGLFLFACDYFNAQRACRHSGGDWRSGRGHEMRDRAPYRAAAFSAFKNSDPLTGASGKN